MHETIRQSWYNTNRNVFLSSSLLHILFLFDIKKSGKRSMSTIELAQKGKTSLNSIKCCINSFAAVIVATRPISNAHMSWLNTIWYNFRNSHMPFIKHMKWQIFFSLTQDKCVPNTPPPTHPLGPLDKLFAVSIFQLTWEKTFLLKIPANLYFL